jgi:hypothetical protein
MNFPSKFVLIVQISFLSAWLFPLFKQQWHQMLAIEQGIDKG